MNIQIAEVIRLVSFHVDVPASRREQPLLNPEASTLNAKLSYLAGGSRVHAGPRLLVRAGDVGFRFGHSSHSIAHSLRGVPGAMSLRMPT